VAPDSPITLIFLSVFAVSNVLRSNASNIDLPACFSEVSIPERLKYLSVVHSLVRDLQRLQAL